MAAMEPDAPGRVGDPPAPVPDPPAPVPDPPAPLPLPLDGDAVVEVVEAEDDDPQAARVTAAMPRAPRASVRRMV